jgi:uncharacterized protein YneF (UPF0154 family)
MNMQKGKITFFNVILLSIMTFAAFLAFKYIASSIDKKQIRKEIFDEIGIVRGRNLTEEKIREIITQVLSKRSLQPLEVFSEIKSNGMVSFSYRYEVTVNYLVFKHKEIVAVEDEMENYG